MSEFFGTAIGIASIIAGIAIWLTHVLVCFAAGAWGFLIAGALFPPIALVHGIAIFFGYSFV
jgi:hypothetical protein